MESTRPANASYNILCKGDDPFKTSSRITSITDAVLALFMCNSLLEYSVNVAKQKVRVFCDFHGHSRQKNVFMYGCSRLQSWWPGDKDMPDSPDFMLLPRLAQNCMSTFSLRDCHFQIERAREATARVAVWRQFDIPMSYTMEASTCGCDQGPYKGPPTR
ncbi:hypothetical protein SK128_000588 [Halocaridina rubra]|uniref:Peptidase M14 domain-containing protein n=1 Tax=Halocaridina rubra TaxID=373956 RepID=A0AAN8XP52_HALRR